MLWSCGTHTEGEDGEKVCSGEVEGLRSALVPSEESTSNDEYFYDDWCDIVRSYCSRSLTYDSDKLIAIQGLAKVLGWDHNKVYTSGIWKEAEGTLKKRRSSCGMACMLPCVITNKKA